MEQQQTINNNVHGWLMSVPNYRQDLYTTKNNTEIRQERPVSVTSISSEDSVNLEELINGNFTTSMEEEADLTELSLLDIDDSKEDFWKVDTIYIPSPTTFNKKPSYYYKNSKEPNNPFQKRVKQDFVNVLDVSCPPIYQYDTPDQSPNRLRVPSLPVSPKSPVSFQTKRSGSFSSEASMNSVSTVTPQRSVRPTESTSTSSFGSQSTNTSALSRSTIPIAESTLHRRQTYLTSSISENTSSCSNLARRATHIPAPSSNNKPRVRQSIIPQRTKSTASSCSQNSHGLSRPVSQMSQPKRESHIPAPRSATSLGVAKSSLLTKPTPSRSKPMNSRPLVQRPKTSNLRLDSTRVKPT